MFRSVAVRLHSTILKTSLNKSWGATGVVTRRCMSHEKTETDEQFDARYEAYFDRKDIDGWEIRKAMNDLSGMDVIPEPKIVNAALKACRRVNDYALAVRFLESLKWQSIDNADIYPYLIKEVKPTLTELGINTPEELGYDKPELALRTVTEV